LGEFLQSASAKAIAAATPAATGALTALSNNGNIAATLACAGTATEPLALLQARRYWHSERNAAKAIAAYFEFAVGAAPAPLTQRIAALQESLQCANASAAAAAAPGAAARCGGTAASGARIFEADVAALRKKLGDLQMQRRVVSVLRTQHAVAASAAGAAAGPIGIAPFVPSGAAATAQRLDSHVADPRELFIAASQIPGAAGAELQLALLAAHGISNPVILGKAVDAAFAGAATPAAAVEAATRCLSAITTPGSTAAAPGGGSLPIAVVAAYLEATLAAADGAAGASGSSHIAAGPDALLRAGAAAGAVGAAYTALARLRLGASHGAAALTPRAEARYLRSVSAERAVATAAAAVRRIAPALDAAAQRRADDEVAEIHSMLALPAGIEAAAF
jgi:hypothetical protein